MNNPKWLQACLDFTQQVVFLYWAIVAVIAILILILTGCSGSPPSSIPADCHPIDPLVCSRPFETVEGGIFIDGGLNFSSSQAFACTDPKSQPAHCVAFGLVFVSGGGNENLWCCP